MEAHQQLRLLALALLIVTLGVEASSRRPLLGSQKCTWGPAYWCNGLKQSSECQATRHCIDNVWSNNPYPADDDEVCTICKNMVREARDQLLSNETQEELKEVFEGSCALIPIKIIANECKKLADEFVPELVETLSSEMNPDTVCTVAGLCNSKRIDKMLQQARNFVVKPPNQKSDCDVCRKQTQKLASQIYHADQDLVLDKILEICGYAGSYSDACRTMVVEDFADIYDVLIHLDDGLCDLSGMCPASNNQLIQPSHGDVQCEFCEKVIQHWIDTWTSNTTEEEFKQVLEALCHKMKPNRVDHCLHIVDDYYIPWFNFILHQLNPKTACTIFGLCNQGHQDDSDAPISLLLAPRAPIVPATTNRLIGGYFAPQTAIELEKPGCVVCEYVIKELVDFLGDNRTEAKIEEGLEKVCDLMPNPLEQQCQHLIETYGPAIAEILAREVDPNEVCTYMHLCNQHEHAVEQISTNPIILEKSKNENCAMCQFVTETLYQILENKDNQEEIKNALETVCRILPSSIEDRCDKYIEEYAETIMQLILKSMTPEQICAELGLCPATLKDTKCVLCEYIMSTLDEMLANKTTEAEIREALDKVCAYLPSSIKGQCVSFVNQYSDVIIDFLTHQISPEQVCQQIGLCQVMSSYAEQFQMLDQVDQLIDDEEQEPRPYCTLCEYAIGEVDKIITDRKNEEEIKNVLDRICYELSTPIKKKCLEMVERYTDELIDMFIAEFTPQEICFKLGLCQPPKIEYGMSNDIIIVDANNVIQETPECVLCEFAMHILEHYVLTNRTMDMTEHALEMICSYMPSTIGDKCIDFIQKYGDEIIDLIVDAELNPKQVCSALMLCQSSDADGTWDATPVGGHKCTWGPAFWCQSKIHAKACGTTKHCEDNVWNNNN